MLYLVVTVCLAGTPVDADITKHQDCRQEFIQVGGEEAAKPTTWECVHAGMSEMAKWWGSYQEKNPNYQIREYHCAQHLPHHEDEGGKGVL